MIDRNTALAQLLQLPGSSWVKYLPWKRKGYCDTKGRCWFRDEQGQSWFLAHPGTVVNVIACLPAAAMPLPTTTTTTKTTDD